MPKILTLAELDAIRSPNQEGRSRFNEGTYVCVECSKSHGGGTFLRANMCELDVNKASGFPLKVIVRVKRRSSERTCSSYAIDHKAIYTFWISYNSIISDNGFDIISKIIFLMNVPFSLDHKIKWRNVESNVTLKNKDALIYKVAEFARSMKDSNEDGFMILDITEETYLSQREFWKMYDNIKRHEEYNFESWERAQRELESRIAKFEALQKEVGIKKMRFEASAFEGSYLSDMCSICMEFFLTGSMVSCINHCFHVYHEVCILEWLLTNRSCPCCRSELGKKL